MNTNFLAIRFLIAITITSTLFTSCDDEISNVGAGALNGSQLDIEDGEVAVTVSQVNVEQPRTNNLDYYLLGNNTDESEITNRFSILSQVFSYSTAIADSFTETTDDDDNITSSTTINYTLESATLVLPFKYSLVETDTSDDVERYSFDSTITGNSLSLNVYLSNYLLQTTAPNELSATTEEYFADKSNGTDFFDESYMQTLLTSYPVDLNQFDYSANSDEDYDFEIPLSFTEEDGEEQDYEGEDKSNLFPAIRIPLITNQEDDTESNPFKTILNEIIIVDNDDDGLKDEIDISAFIDEDILNTFRGLYIESSSDSNAIIDILQSNTYVNSGIQLIFSKQTNFIDNENTDNNEITNETVITTLNLSNPINFIDKTENSQLTQSSTEIILEGGLGKVAQVDLFENDDLQNLISENILLNNAVLKLTVNTESEYFTSEEDLPDNIFINHFENGSVLTDYTNNSSSESAEDNIESIQENHLISIRDENGDIIYDENGNITYEIVITQHLANILNQDTDEDANNTNTSLVISTTNNLNTTNTSRLFNPKIEQYINQGSLLSFKTVPLYSSNEGDINKKPRVATKYTSTSIEEN